MRDIANRRFPKVSCFVCKKQVDRMSFQDDVYRAAIVLRVFCHGEVDRMDLTKHFLVEADPDLRLEEGISFQPKAEPTLAAPAMRLTNG